MALLQNWLARCWTRSGSDTAAQAFHTQEACRWHNRPSPTPSYKAGRYECLRSHAISSLWQANSAPGFFVCRLMTSPSAAAICTDVRSRTSVINDRQLYIRAAPHLSGFTLDNTRFAAGDIRAEPVCRRKFATLPWRSVAAVMLAGALSACNKSVIFIKAHSLFSLNLQTFWIFIRKLD